jgi:transposase-like protein
MDDAEARAYLESLRWPDGPICPHCGADKPYRLTPKPTSKTRKGVLKCRACRKQFTVTVGTIFEDSHIPLAKWLMAIHLLCASKKGMSAHQLHRMLGVTYKSAWFMAHRIRYSMEQEPLKSKLSGVVEVDETYIGGKPRKGQVRSRQEAGRWKATHKPMVVALVERDGDVRSIHRRTVTERNLKQVVRDNVEPSARVMTDSFPAYRGLDRHFAGHGTVDHSRQEYRRGDAYTQTVESYFAILKRGINGVYHHVGEQHLHRYLAEFDFRYNRRKVEDGVRAALAVRGAEGKRLTFKPLTGSDL